jgi:hypothetical protein
MLLGCLGVYWWCQDDAPPSEGVVNTQMCTRAAIIFSVPELH